MLYEDEVSIITFFKDITFGILYEKMSSKFKLEDKISKTLHSKVTEPIFNVMQELNLYTKKQYIDDANT